MTEFSLVLCTCPDKEVAERIATQLVSQKLAACVNIVDNISSCYQWQGEVQMDRECQLIIKTLTHKVDHAFEAVQSLHPYDTPEWLTLDINHGSPDYLNWIRSTLK